MIDFSAHPLVETTWLEAHLEDPDLRIVDARWRGDGSSPELYKCGHLPGAVHLDWHHDLSWTDERGVRDLLLPPESFAAILESVGIGDSTHRTNASRHHLLRRRHLSLTRTIRSPSSRLPQPRPLRRLLGRMGHRPKSSCRTSRGMSFHP